MRPYIQKKEIKLLPCPTCNGKGLITEDGVNAICLDCGGSGEISQVVKLVKPRFNPRIKKPIK